MKHSSICRVYGAIPGKILPTNMVDMVRVTNVPTHGNADNQEEALRQATKVWGWGGHWPTRLEMPHLDTGKGKEAMEPPITKSKRPLEALSARFSLHPGHDAAVETTTCHFCRRADLWLYLTCGVCQLTTHATCYYRLGSDEAAYYETNSADWRCQDCGGPQRHTDCALSDDGQVVQRHVGSRLYNSGYPASGDGGVAVDCVLSNAGQGIQRHAAARPSNSGYAALGVPSEDYAMGSDSNDSCIVQQHSKNPRRQQAKKHKRGIRPPRPEETKRS